MVTGIQQTYDKRGVITKQMTDITTQAAKEARAMTTDEETTWKRLDAEYEGLTTTIEAYKRDEQRAAEAATKEFVQRDAGGGQWKSDATAPIADKGLERERRAAFDRYYRYGAANLSPEEREILKRGTSNQIVGTTTLGGHTVPQDYMAEMVRTMKDYSGIMQACRVMYTENGQALPWPTTDDTGTLAILTTEAAAVTIADITYGQKTLNAYKYTTAVKISQELLQDSAFDMSVEVPGVFGDRFGRAINLAATTADGSSKPQGFVPATSAGKTTASATAFTFPEIIDLIHSINPAYRRSPNFGLMFHDTILAAVKKLTIGSGDARPLWQPSVREGEPDRLEGYRYWINQDMDDAVTAAKKIMAAGDFSKFVIRMVKEMTVLRQDELYSANGLVGFQAWARWDSELLDAGAIKHMITAAS